MLTLGNYIFVPEFAIEAILKEVCPKLKDIYGEEKITLIGVERGGYEVAKRVDSIIKCGEVITYDPDRELPIEDADYKKIRGAHILICEDSVSTGNTLNRVIYTAFQAGAKDIQVIAIASQKESKIIPNIYSIEGENNTIFCFPWKTPPLRPYNISCIIRNLSGMEKLFGLTAQKITQFIRPNPLQFKLITIGLDTKEGLIGFLQMWEGDKELIVESLETFIPIGKVEEERILCKLHNMALNYEHFHNKEKITFLVPKTETKKWTNQGYKLIKHYTLPRGNFSEVCLVED